MRVGAAEFGPLALAFVRVAGASLLLLPLLWWLSLIHISEPTRPY